MRLSLKIGTAALALITLTQPSRAQPQTAPAPQISHSIPRCASVPVMLRALDELGASLLFSTKVKERSGQPSGYLDLYINVDSGDWFMLREVQGMPTVCIVSHGDHGEAFPVTSNGSPL